MIGLKLYKLYSVQLYSAQCSTSQTGVHKGTTGSLQVTSEILLINFLNIFLVKLNTAVKYNFYILYTYTNNYINIIYKT